jgi:hypothetical protein
MSQAKVDSKINVELGVRVIRRDGTVEEPFAVPPKDQKDETDAAPPSHPVEEG